MGRQWQSNDAAQWPWGGGRAPVAGGGGGGQLLWREPTERPCLPDLMHTS